MEKVLVAAPTSRRKAEVNEPWAVFCKNSLSYPHDTLVVDNSFDYNYRKVFDRVGVESLYVSPKGQYAFEIIANCQNLIRNRVLTQNYEWLLFLETDLLYPPIDIIERLIAFNQPVVGAMYLIGTQQKEFMINHIKTVDNTISNYKSTFREDFKLLGQNKLLQVCSVGFGCTLIHRSVLDLIPFSATKDNASDAFFFNDCARELIPVYLDLGTYINHYNNDWGMFINKSVII